MTKKKNIANNFYYYYLYSDFQNVNYSESTLQNIKLFYKPQVSNQK